MLWLALQEAAFLGIRNRYWVIIVIIVVVVLVLGYMVTRRRSTF